MLDPHTRALLLDALQPPAEFVFDEGLATTFSLDLLALLTAPLGLAATSVSGDLRAAWSDETALTVLRTVRDLTGRLTVFCDAGHIAVPARGEPLFTFLEPAIVPARAPADGGAFHPKCWLLRFQHENDPNEVVYRLLVLTRNLTFDRSLDLVVALEGALRSPDRPRARPAVPIRRFVEALNGMSIQPLDRSHRARLRRFAREVERTDFRASAPFDEAGWEFQSFGHDGGWEGLPFEAAATRRLVISPFLAAGTLEELGASADEAIVISRESELATIPPDTLEPFRTALIPRPALTEADPTEIGDGSAATVAGGDLHAKCYIDEDGSRTARWYVGSANATWHAFHKNVEILLRLNGPRRDVGIRRLLPDDALHLLGAESAEGSQPAPLAGNVEFVDLWEAYQPSGEPVADTETDAERHQRAADDHATALARLPWSGVVEAAGDGTFDVTLRSATPVPDAPPNVTRATIRPLLQPNADERGVHDGEHTWHAFSLVALSAFWVLTVRVGRGADAGTRRCMLYAPLEGAPDGREAAVTRTLLSSEARLIRFLQLLLTTDEDEIAAGDGDGTSDFMSGAHAAAATANGLLEVMLRAFSVRPDRVLEAGRIIDDLAAHDDGRAVLPDGLLELWATFREAAKRAGINGASSGRRR